jgi:hypothetical protein
MDWQQLVLSKGLRWELILSRQSPQGQRLFSLRLRYSTVTLLARFLG